MPNFLTVRKAAQTGLLSEYRLRLLVAAGECPGIKVGNRFMVNIEALAEMLDEQSRRCMREGGAST